MEFAEKMSEMINGEFQFDLVIHDEAHNVSQGPFEGYRYLPEVAEDGRRGGVQCRGR